MKFDQKMKNMRKHKENNNNSLTITSRHKERNLLIFYLHTKKMFLQI